ncbi:MAG: phosphoenolpyruvate--protein phosphotransferase [Opitutales bacterium]|nr:phosphoenolpyruvate--protein phosphotransferase [Opitutales bacterium]
MDDQGKEERILKGIPASPGVAHGPAFLFLKKELEIPSYQVPEDRREEEISRFEAAIVETRKQINTIRSEIEEKLGEDEAQIFDAHQLVLEDRALLDETEKEVLTSGYNIEHCYHKVANRYIQAFSNIDDDYIKERVADIKDVSRRLLHNLLGQIILSLTGLIDPVVIVSEDLTPSDTANIDTEKVFGIVTDQGSRTSHAVIMARSIKVPAVVGLHNITEQVKPGDMLIVDGYDGVVIINPSESSLFRYGKIRHERENIEKRFSSVLDFPSITQDNVSLDILLNVEGTEPEHVYQNSGATGVGLFRTEALFLKNEIFPTEEEQFRAYKRVVQMQPENAPVIIRTLDLGGDKNPVGGKFGYAEANPFMGFRAIRFCLEEPDVFKVQLRAILRASAYGNIHLMLPMIVSAEEVYSAKRMIRECCDELDAKGLAYNREIKIGTMIETPAAAAIADILAQECDFFSIGSNDMIQYLLAVDRVNDRIAHLYNPYHPAVIRTLRHVITIARNAGIPVGICGEVAGDPVYAALLFGMGATSISVTAAMVPEIKYLIRTMSFRDAQNLAADVCSLVNPDEIEARMKRFYDNRMRDVLTL